MYIIIAGGGVIGFHIASLLAEEGQEVVVVEKSEEVLENLRRQLDVKTIQGNAATPKVLRQAEAERADLVLAVTNSDETNMVTSFMAKELGAATTAARIRNPEYSGYFVTPAKSPLAPRKVVRPKSLGIDVFINPEAEAAEEIMSILSSFYSTPVENFADGLIQIREFKVEGEALADKPLADIKYPKPCVLAAVVHEGGIIQPEENPVIAEGDSVYLIAHRDDMDDLGKLFIHPQRPARKVVVFGGGSIGFLTAVMKDVDTGRDMASIFISTTPNPTTGYMQVVPLEDVSETNWTVEEAVKLLMSGGVLTLAELGLAQAALEVGKQVRKRLGVVPHVCTRPGAAALVIPAALEGPEPAIGLPQQRR